MSRNIFRMTDEKLIRGKCLQAYLLRRGKYQLIDVEIYEDGMVRWEAGIQPWETFVNTIKRGRIVTQLPEQALVHLGDLNSVCVSNILNFIDENELLKEAADLLAAMRGEHTSTQRFKQCWEAFLVEPTEDHRAALEVTYLDVPEHLRQFLLGDQDFKDAPIRAAIEGTLPPSEIEKRREMHQRPGPKRRSYDMWW